MGSWTLLMMAIAFLSSAALTVIWRSRPFSTPAGQILSLLACLLVALFARQIAHYFAPMPEAVIMKGLNDLAEQVVHVACMGAGLVMGSKLPRL